MVAQLENLLQSLYSLFCVFKMSFKVCQIGPNYGNKREQAIMQHKDLVDEYVESTKMCARRISYVVDENGLDSTIVAQATTNLD